MPLKNCPCCGSGDVAETEELSREEAHRRWNRRDIELTNMKLNIGKMVEDIARTYAERVGCVCEKRIHDELVKLGWTPPPEKKDQEG